jgi:hypothetical protein
VFKKNESIIIVVMIVTGWICFAECIKLGKKMKIHSMDQGVEHLLILSSDGKPFEYNFSIEHARWGTFCH